MKDFTNKQIDIIKNALVEYEENHYMTEDNEWQNEINNLISYFKQAKKRYIMTRFGEAIECKAPPVNASYIDTESTKWFAYDIYRDTENNIYAVDRR